MDKINIFDVRTSITEKVIDVFDMMLSMEVEPSDDVSLLTLDGNRIVGSVSFAGEVIGIVNIYVSEPFAHLMTASMLGIEVEEIEGEEEVKDVLGEVSNIIGGKLKSDFSDAGFYCQLSTPSITSGTDFKIESLNMARQERFFFRYKEHAITVEVAVKMESFANCAVQDHPSEVTETLKTIEDAPQGKIPDAAESLKTIEDAPQDDIPESALDIKTVIVEKVIDVFDMMLSMEVEPSDDVSLLTLDGNRIVGSVSFAGEVMGSVNIQVSEPFSRIMTASMLGIEVEEIEGEEEVKDVLGEVSNIIGGKLKSDFCDAGLTCVLSTPSITSGTDFKIESLNMARQERFAFRYKEHIISVEMGVKVESHVNCAVQDHPAEVTEILKTIEEPAQEKVPNVTQPLKTLEDAPQGKTPEVTETLKTIEEPAQEKSTEVIEHMGIDSALDFLLDIPLEMSIELGRTKMSIDELLNLGDGSVVELTAFEGEPVDILISEKLIARGEVVIEDGKYGIRITEIMSRMERIKNLG